MSSVKVEGRPYSTIETNLVRRLLEIVLSDAEQAFKPLSPVHFNIDRLETNPRFAAVARPANAAILVKLRIDMEDRGGRVEEGTARVLGEDEAHGPDERGPFLGGDRAQLLGEIGHGTCLPVG